MDQASSYFDDCGNMEKCQTLNKEISILRSPNSFPPHRIPISGGSQALQVGQLLGNAAEFAFDPISAAWDTFRFWDDHETSTDNPVCHISGICRRFRPRPNAGKPSRSREKGPAASACLTQSPRSLC